MPDSSSRNSTIILIVTILTWQGPFSLQSLESSRFHLSKNRTKKHLNLPRVNQKLLLLQLLVGNLLLLLAPPNSLKLKHQLLKTQSLSHLNLRFLLGHPFLSWTGLSLWWKGYTIVSLDYHLSCSLTTIMFGLALRQLRHNWIKFSTSLNQTFSHSWQKGRKFFIFFWSIWQTSI